MSDPLMLCTVSAQAVRASSKEIGRSKTRKSVSGYGRMIADKVVFASAHPFVEQADALAAYAAMPLTDEVRRKVLYENALRVLGESAA